MSASMIFARKIVPRSTGLTRRGVALDEGVSTTFGRAFCAAAARCGLDCGRTGGGAAFGVTN